MGSRRRRWWCAVLAAVVANGFGSSSPAAQIFADGFEECGLGRWSTSTLEPPPDQLSDLTPEVLATALGACGPSLQSAQLLLADGSVPNATALSEITNFQTAVMQQLGTGGLTARAGGSMAVFSNGRARDTGSPGYVAPSPGTSYNRSGSAPAAYLAAHGGTLPAPLECPSVGSSANDSVALRLTFTVPDTASALVFEWLFATADYPPWVCTAFTDYFLALVDGSSILLPTDGNVALDNFAGNPVSASWQAPVMPYCATCPGGAGPLAGTGYEAFGATGWHTATVPVVPGETLTLDLIVFDVGDSAEDSLVLVDGLRWVTP